jgi:hypothetical protein
MTTAGSPTPPVYHRVETSVRPVRVASLIYDLEDWVPAAQRMIELLSRIWGGHGAILVAASNDGTVSDDLWRLLERFDPDRLGYYVPTHRGRQMADPAGFEQWLDHEAERWAQMTGVTSHQEARRQLLDSNVLRMPLTTWEPPPALEARARRRLAPLDPAHPFDQAWVPDDDPGSELLDISNVRQLEGLPVLSLRAEAIDRRVDLMVMSRMGAVSPSFGKALKKRGVEVVSAEANQDHLRYVLDLCWASEPRRRTLVEAALQEILGEAHQPAWDPAYLDRTPFAVTELGCRWYVVGRPWGRELPYVVVVGDAARDFCFAMGLDRMYGNAIWVPFAFISGDDELAGKVRSYLARHLDEVSGRGYGHARPVVVTSLSIDRAAFESHAGKLWELAVAGDVGARVQWVDPGEVELPKPMRLYDSGQVLRQRWEPFVGRELAGALDTPKPSGISEMNPMEFVWHVDVAIDTIRFPPRSCLNQIIAVLGDTERESVRASSDGISYFSREPFFIPAGVGVEQMMFRPHLRIPDATEIFQKLLEAGGLRGVVSQAGRYTQGVLDLWGGLAGFASDLRDSRRLALLEAYRRTSRSGVDPGVYLDGLRRRFLSLWDARRATGMTTEAVRELLDEYLQRGILARGFCLKCPLCNFAGWYLADEVGHTFVCVRCRADSWVTQAAWLKPRGEPLWFYQLDEIAYQALDHNVRAPMLALDQIRGESRGFLFAPEMDVFDDAGRVAEVDLWIIAEAAIIIGEAKTTNRLAEVEQEEAQMIRRLARVAQAVTAHELVLATTDARWGDRTMRLVDEALARADFRARFLTGLGT